VGRKITVEVLEFLQGGTLPQHWNETIIALIPKVSHLDYVTDLRPIGLCNVLYKISSNFQGSSKSLKKRSCRL
jgi:hypothetical protein